VGRPTGEKKGNNCKLTKKVFRKENSKTTVRGERCQNRGVGGVGKFQLKGGMGAGWVDCD